MKRKQSFLADFSEGGTKLSRDVTFSCHEVPDGKQRAEKLAEILSTGVYAYLKHKGAVRKQSALKGEEN